MENMHLLLHMVMSREFQTLVTLASSKDEKISMRALSSSMSSLNS